MRKSGQGIECCCDNFHRKLINSLYCACTVRILQQKFTWNVSASLDFTGLYIFYILLMYRVICGHISLIKKSAGGADCSDRFFSDEPRKRTQIDELDRSAELCQVLLYETRLWRDVNHRYCLSFCWCSMRWLNTVVGRFIFCELDFRQHRLAMCALCLANVDCLLL